MRRLPEKPDLFAPTADQLPVPPVAKDWQVQPLFRGNVRRVLWEIQNGK